MAPRLFSPYKARKHPEIYICHVHIRAVVSYWRKYAHEVVVNRLGGQSLPRKSVVKLTDRPDMTLDVNRGRKTTIQQQQHNMFQFFLFSCVPLSYMK